MSELVEMIDQEDEVSIKLHDLDESIFHVVEKRQGEKVEFFGVLGNARVTEIFDNIPDAVEETERFTWAKLWVVFSQILKDIPKYKEVLDEAERIAQSGTGSEVSE